MEDAKRGTEVVLQAMVDVINSADVDGYVNCFHDKLVMLPHEHGVVVKGKTELRDYAAKIVSRFSKLSLKGTLDFQMLGEDYAVGCYHIDAYDNQDGVFRPFTDLIVWQQVAGAWLMLRATYAALM